MSSARAGSSRPLDRTAARHRWLLKASSVAVPLAAAAGVLFLLGRPATTDVFVPGSSSTLSTSSTSATTGAGALSTTELAAIDPETTFKGGVQIAVIRERAGQQSRFTGTVAVKPGDRLRVEVALDREQAILAAVMGDDASWLELMTEGARRPGTHFSERSARVDGTPLRGTILVGWPDAVARARSTRRFDEVASIRVEWESP